MDARTWEELKQIDVRTVNPEELVDIREVEFAVGLSEEERMRSFLTQIKNPYCFKCGKLIVKVVFAENGGRLEELLADAAENL